MQIRRILVPIDGSALSLKAAGAAASLAARFGASLVLLTAIEPPEAMSADAICLCEPMLLRKEQIRCGTFSTDTSYRPFCW
jgi:nucleotide-binding universal stress UspA family protein